MSAEGPESQVARLREQLLLAQARISDLEASLADLERRLEQERTLTSQAQSLADRLLDIGRISALETDLVEASSQLDRVYRRMMELDAERRAMQRSRSWRWTAPIRSIERWWTRRK